MWVGRTGTPLRDCQGQASRVSSHSQTLPTPAQIAYSIVRGGGGFGDFYHVSMFSAEFMQTQ